ncbi:MAG: kelch repeat-containing protein [bacterium]
MERAVYFLLLIISLLLNNSALKAKAGWTFKTPMPTARSGFCAVVFNGKIYVLGGRNNSGEVLNLVERYDPISNTWETGLPSLKDERENAAAVVFDNKIFILGGRSHNNGHSDDGEVLKTVEFFDPTRNQWEEFKDLKKKREGLAVVVLNDTLYAIGGFNEGEKFLNDIEFYDADSKKWENWDKINSRRLDFARTAFVGVAVRDSAFVIGGFSNLGPLRFVERFHPAAGTAERGELFTPRGGLTGTVVNDTIFVMGGRDPIVQVLNTVEFFVPHLNRWKEASPLNLARENFAAVTVNNKIYVIGGLDPNKNVLASVEVADVTDIVTSVSTIDHTVPSEFSLKQNYPNPFNAGTKIKFLISSKSRAAAVKLSIYNLPGQLITTLVNDRLKPGEYEVLWEGTDQKGLPVASGIYIYTLQQGQNKESKKMMLIR